MALISGATNSPADNSGVILVVDDNATNRHLLRAILEADGFVVEESANGSDCVTHCLDATPDVVILDVMMPVMNGIEACRKLRESFTPDELAIVLSSTLDESQDIASGLAAGANDYLTKPIERVVLLARLRQLIELRRSRTRMRELESKLNQRVRMDTVSQFATGIAHNFNNLFGGMLGATDLLTKITAGNARAERCLAVIRGGIDSGIKLTRKMAVLTRAESNESGSGARAATVLSDVLSNIFEVQRNLVGDRVMFSSQVLAQDLCVAMDEQHLIDVLASLIHNAVDAIPERGAVTVTAERVVDSSDSSKRVEVRIVDTGSGMNEGILGRLYEPFFSTKTLDQVNGVSIQGNGLGMWNVYNLVKMAGGEIEVRSAPGKGTTFILGLPAFEQ